MEMFLKFSNVYIVVFRDDAHVLISSCSIDPADHALSRLWTNAVNKPFLIARSIHTEENGSVSVFEHSTIPFAVQRAFLVTAFDGQTRGDHAHRQCWQALFVISGKVLVKLKYKSGQEQFLLEPDGNGLVIPPLVWATQEYSGSKPCLLVVCSHTYDAADYIRSFIEFNSQISDC